MNLISPISIKFINDRTGIHIVSSSEYEDLLPLIDDLILVKGEIENLHTLCPNPIIPNLHVWDEFE
jgi:hypothetical protein